MFLGFCSYRSLYDNNKTHMQTRLMFHNGCAYVWMSFFWKQKISPGWSLVLGLKLATQLFTSTLSGWIYPHGIVCLCVRARVWRYNMKKERLQWRLYWSINKRNKAAHTHGCTKYIMQAPLFCVHKLQIKTPPAVYHFIEAFDLTLILTPHKFAPRWSIYGSSCSCATVRSRFCIFHNFSPPPCLFWARI